MFTGLVEGIGRVREVEAAGSGLRLSVDLGPLADGVRPGDSVCVAGVCLTVAGLRGSVAQFEVSEETVHRTRFGEMAAGAGLNLERSLRLGDRLGGHFVTGHVDARGRLLRREASDGFARDLYEAPPAVQRLLAEKGSVAVDGVSLTVAALDAQGFWVALIPETLARTTLGTLRPGEDVHLEADLIARHLERLLDRTAGAGRG